MGDFLYVASIFAGKRQSNVITFVLNYVFKI